MEKSLIITCIECGRTEEGPADRALMVKIRMLNHMTREHPYLVDDFKDAVDAREIQLR